MNRHTALAIATLLGLAVAAPQTAFSQSDPFLGTWQFNPAKSKYSPGPPPRAETSNTQAEGQNLKFALTGTSANGNSISTTLTAVIDGMPHPQTGVPDNPNAAYDAAATTRVDAYTLIFSFTKAGKLVQVSTLVVSPDGKTTTLTRTGADANGRPVNDLSVWDKQ